MSHKKEAPERNIVKLCKDCDKCPTVEFTADGIVITDDQHGKKQTLHMKHEPAALLLDALELYYRSPRG